MKAICRCIVLTLVVSASAVGRANWDSAISESNPLNWYRFNERTGNTAVDYGSEHRNGTYGIGPLDATRGVDGLVGIAAQFGDQSTVFLSAPDIVGDWSAEFVLMRTGSKRSSVLIRGIPFAFPSGSLKLEQYFNTHQVGYTKYGITDATFVPAVISPLNDWIHLVYINQAAEDRIRLYVNGTLAGTRIDHFDLSRDQIGSWSDTIPESPLAVMDEVVLYNRALSAAEVFDHYNAIPEPSACALSGFALLSVACATRQRMRQLNRR
jgi:Concanavalin A-like lectin/glucanases superfamily